MRILLLSSTGDWSWLTYHLPETLMFLTIALVLFVLWILGFLAFHVTMGAIHIVLVVAAIALVLHFVRGRGGRPVV
ncbi:MAG: hypothetical protein NVS1B4_25120 [Gemmatimonadaceae bacterium]